MAPFKTKLISATSVFAFLWLASSLTTADASAASFRAGLTQTPLAVDALPPVSQQEDTWNFIRVQAIEEGHTSFMITNVLLLLCCCCIVPAACCCGRFALELGEETCDGPCMSIDAMTNATARTMRASFDQDCPEDDKSKYCTRKVRKKSTALFKEADADGKGAVALQDLREPMRKYLGGFANEDIVVSAFKSDPMSTITRDEFFEMMKYFEWKRDLYESSSPSEPDIAQDEGYIEFEEVLQQEQKFIKKNASKRFADGQCHLDQGEQKFSIAFSGGGIRAAAFQAGVLWRLAKENKLKDVEYFTAVSGGGYILAAFASHCMDPDDQPEAGNVKEWYLKVVAQTLTRMQENAGDFIRDCWKDPGGPRKGAGLLPRIFDTPILLVVTMLAIIVNPAFFTFAVAVPMTHMIAFYRGPSLRAAFCARDFKGQDWLEINSQLSNVGQEWIHLCVLISITFIVWIARKVVPALKTPTWADRSQPRPESSWLYALGHAAQGGLIRISLMIFMFAGFVSLLPVIERQLYSDTERHSLCHAYINGQMQHYTSTTNVPQEWMCSDLHQGQAWFQLDQYKDYREVPLGNGTVSTVGLLKKDVDPSGVDVDVIGVDVDVKFQLGKDVGVISVLLCVFAAAGVLGLILLPFLGSGLITTAISLLGPLFLFLITLKLGLVLVYHPITGNRKGYHVLDQSGDVNVHRSVSICFTLALFMLPFYEDCRSVLHHYYKRCLSTNYFKDGKDTFFSEHNFKVNKLFYCPFFILTGTSSDFQPPGDTDLISELSFSALHCGGEETKYVKTSPYRTLSKCAALTGAGCLDAISLTMAQTVSIRFWLEFLNLSWGDFITFQPGQKQGIKNIHTRLEDIWQKEFGEAGYSKIAKVLSRALLRMPAIAVLLVIYGLWNGAVFFENAGQERKSCESAESLYDIGFYLMCGAVLASFFYFVPVLQYMAVSPFLRQIHQVSKYFYVGYEPPKMLYVTDGGVQDCTGISQLIIRRCERILLILAAMDNADDLAVLKTAMELARHNRWCSFYDPSDPRRDVGHLFEEFKKDKDQLDMRIGIYYPAENGKPVQTGHLYIVKNRLPAKMANQPVEAPLSESEITGESGAMEWDAEAWKELTTDKLGPCGCCDCCHTHLCNCGPKFPGGNAHGYLFLTPKWFSSLARLSYEISDEAIKKLSGQKILSSTWEQSLAQATPAQDLSMG